MHLTNLSSGLPKSGEVPRAFCKYAKVSPLSSAADESVRAPSEAWCIFQGASPCRVRANHPPISSVAPMAEPKFFLETYEGEQNG